MSGNQKIEFMETDVDALKKSLISSFEKLSGRTLYPADPERLLILWIANVIVAERVNANWAANQNLPQYAEGKYLDALADLFKGVSRLPATPASTTIRFHLSESKTDPILIAEGTRVSTDNGITFSIPEAVYIPAGATTAESPAVCQTAGEIGNGLLPGQINRLIDVFPYFNRCENITTSAGGADLESDESLYKRMKASEDTYSTAGPMGGYEFFAKSVSGAIADVRAISPSAGCVSVYPLLENGEIPDDEILNAVEKVLSADDVRPLTDKVTVLPPNVVEYEIDLTYYIPSESAASASTIEAAVIDAVDKFIFWQNEKLGRDINPSKLISLLMDAGIKRVEVRKPAFAIVNDGGDGKPVQVAKLTGKSIKNGGYEDE